MPSAKKRQGKKAAKPPAPRGEPPEAAGAVRTWTRAAVVQAEQAAATAAAAKGAAVQDHDVALRAGTTCVPNSPDAVLGDLRDTGIRLGQHAALYLHAVESFGEENGKSSAPEALVDLCEGYRQVAQAYVQLERYKMNPEESFLWKTRLPNIGKNPMQYVALIEEHARTIEAQTWRAIGLNKMIAFLGHEPISDARMVLMLCVFAVQDGMPTDPPPEDQRLDGFEMAGMLQFAWKHLTNIGRIATIVDVVEIMSTAVECIRWARKHNWTYKDHREVWSSISEWFSRLKLCYDHDAVPTPKRSPRGMPTCSLIDLVAQVKLTAAGTWGWWKSIDPRLFVECTRRADVTAHVNKRVRLPITPTSLPGEVKIALQGIGMRLADDDVRAWFWNTPFEVRYLLAKTQLLEPPFLLCQRCSSAVHDWAQEGQQEVGRSRRMYGSSSHAASDLVPDWSFAIVAAVRTNDLTKEVSNLDKSAEEIERDHTRLPIVPQPLLNALEECAHREDPDPIRTLSAATATRPELRPSPNMTAASSALARRARFAKSVSDAVDELMGKAPRYYAFGPDECRISYMGTYGAKSQGCSMLCTDLTILQPCNADAKLDPNLMKSTADAIDEAVVVRPGYECNTFVRRTLVDIPNRGPCVPLAGGFRTWMLEMCIGILECIYPEIEERNAEGVPFADRRDEQLLNVVLLSVEEAFCLAVTPGVDSVSVLQAKIRSALTQCLLAVTARLVACQKIRDHETRPMLTFTAGWAQERPDNPWRLIEPVFKYKWPIRHYPADPVCQSLVHYPSAMPKGIACKINKRLKELPPSPARKQLMDRWSAYYQASEPTSTFCAELDPFSASAGDSQPPLLSLLVESAESPIQYASA